MKDPRLPEIAWLLVIAVLVAMGGGRMLPKLQTMPLLGSLLLLVALAGTIVMIRRAYQPSSPTVRQDVTKGVAYCCAAVLGLIAVAGRQHWAIGSCIAAFEVALVFDIVTIAARPHAAGEQR